MDGHLSRLDVRESAQCTFRLGLLRGWVLPSLPLSFASSQNKGLVGVNTKTSFLRFSPAVTRQGKPGWRCPVLEEGWLSGQVEGEGPPEAHQDLGGTSEVQMLGCPWKIIDDFECSC